MTDKVQTPEGEATPLLPTTPIPNEKNKDNNKAASTVLALTTGIPASLYVLSGVSQPLIMTLCKDAGLADKKAQFYMLFYYLGPASVGIQMWRQAHESLPSTAMVLRAGGITLFDITAQSMNYTGAALAGPTIFAIIYSSVTVWTAVFSRLLLQRKLLPGQWLGVLVCFGGLALTGLDKSVETGSDVLEGLVLVVLGSAMHGLTYVFSEFVMVVNEEALATIPAYFRKLMGDKNEQRLSVVQNCAIQGIFAVLFLSFWQVVYTAPRFDELILEPMAKSETSYASAVMVLLAFALANLIHALSYFFTLRHFPGGATSAGVMKGLQAVLVFVVSHFFFCGHTGGSEMCFTTTKFVSLCTVVGGVALFGIYTEKQHQMMAQEKEKRESNNNVAV